MNHDVLIDMTDPFNVDSWTPSCSCGWVGEDWKSYDDAEVEGGEHRYEAIYLSGKDR